MKYLLSLCALAVASTALAQPWNLEQCISYAIDHNLQIKMQELTLSTREHDLNTAQHSWLPSVSANVGQSFGFGRSQGLDNIIVNRNAASTSASLSANMPLFTGFQITNNIRLQLFNVNAATEALKQAKESIAMAVAQAYLDVLLRKEIFYIDTLAKSFTTESVRRTEAMVSNGKVPQAQLYEIRSQLASDEATLTTADNNVRLGLLTLAQLLEVQADTFDITMPSLDSTALMQNSLPSVAQIYGRALDVKPQIRVAEWQVEASRSRLKIAQAGHYPQLNLSAGMGNDYSMMFGENNPTLSAQLRTNMRESIGLSLNIPIFSRFATRNSVRSARVNISYQELALEDAKKTLYKEIEQAYQNAVSAQKSYQAAQKSVAAAREAFRYADSKYQTGKSSVYEYSEAKTALARSLSQEAQAKYSYVFALKILDFYSGQDIRL